MSIFDSEDIVYVQCPNCKKGYTGEFGGLVFHEEDCEHNTAGTLKSLFIKTFNAVVNLVEKQVCYNCGHHYNPVKSAKIKRMEKFTADRLINMEVE